jgi:hypothetical protein
MNTINNLIKSHIDKLSDVTVAYQYSELHETHLLEIIPSDRLDQDEVFNAIQDIIDSHIKTHPFETWYVVSPGSRIQMVGASEFVYSKQDGHTDSSSVNSVYQIGNGEDIRTTLIKIVVSDLRIQQKVSTDQSIVLFNDMTDYALAA